MEIHNIRPVSRVVKSRSNFLENEDIIDKPLIESGNCFSLLDWQGLCIGHLNWFEGMHLSLNM